MEIEGKRVLVTGKGQVRQFIEGRPCPGESFTGFQD
jgi:hypothetical protein